MGDRTFVRVRKHWRIKAGKIERVREHVRHKPRFHVRR